MYFLDPANGRERRKLARERSPSLIRRDGRGPSESANPAD
jgi:hypothetical protein